MARQYHCSEKAFHCNHCPWEGTRHHSTRFCPKCRQRLVKGKRPPVSGPLPEKNGKASPVMVPVDSLLVLRKMVHNLGLDTVHLLVEAVSQA